VLRYLVVDLDRWLPGREVLLSSSAIGQWQWAQHTLSVSLTKAQIQNSPDVSTDLPVARQHEEQLARHYGWPMYWATSMYGGIDPMVMPAPANREGHADEDASAPHDPHLRSANEVRGYRIQTTDLRLGRLADLLYDAKLTLRLLELRTRRLLPGGRKLVVQPAWVRNIDWSTRRIALNLSVDQLLALPTFEPGLPIDEYDRRLARWREEHRPAA